MLELLVPHEGEVCGGDGHIQPGGASDRGLLEPPLSSSPITGFFSVKRLGGRIVMNRFVQSHGHGYARANSQAHRMGLGSMVFRLSSGGTGGSRCEIWPVRLGLAEFRWSLWTRGRISLGGCIRGLRVRPGSTRLFRVGRCVHPLLES
jgi:hypothetical protein